MKKFAMLLAIVMVTVFSASVIVAADAPEKVTIKDVQKAKSAVVFPHKAHADRIKNCAECHHKDAAGKEQKCFACHKAEKKGATSSLKDAMHTKCKDCHAKDATKKAPTKCDGCHPK
ncbi:MAG TPA: cytochrome c3 family protein [Candidatus Deferrimicrobium sp.]|nr:cytochrome c3 family protein [Candidatus Deferrimicrobium sp.]